MRAAANTANKPPIIAAVVTTLPTDNAAAPERVAAGDWVERGAGVSDMNVGDEEGAAEPKSPPLDPEASVGAELEMSSTEVGAAVGTPVLMSRIVAVGAAVWAVGVGAIVKEKSRVPSSATGAMVMPGARGAAVGAASAGDGVVVKVPGAITQGAVPPQGTPLAAIVAEQQSDAPAVPATLPQPTPPQTPLQASAQQMLPSATPGIPFGHMEGVTAATIEKGHGWAEGLDRDLTRILHYRREASVSAAHTYLDQERTRGVHDAGSGALDGAQLAGFADLGKAAVGAGEAWKVPAGGAAAHAAGGVAADEVGLNPGQPVAAGGVGGGGRGLDARGGGAVALYAGCHDGGGTALAGVDAGDGSAPLPAAEVTTFERAADVRVRVLHTGLSVVADRGCRGGLWRNCKNSQEGTKEKTGVV